MRATGLALMLTTALAHAQGIPLADAIRATLKEQRGIKIAEENARESGGLALSLRGAFDVSLLASLGQRGETTPQTLFQQSINGGLTNSQMYTTSYSLGLSKQFQFGMTLTPTITLNRTSLTGVDPSYGVARINFSVVQPLLRGRGKSSTAARLIAADNDAQVSALVLQHTITERVSQTVQAYFGYVAAHQSVAILRAAEERASKMLADQAHLVREGEQPAAELKQLEANLADFRLQRIDLERAEVEARQALGLAMGVAWDRIAALPAPSDDLPALDLQAVPGEGEAVRMVQLALDRRFDRQAARLAIRTPQALLVGARRALEPQLDLQLDLGYGGLTESNGGDAFVAPLWSRVEGVNFFGGLAFQYPVGTHAARGQAQQANAQLRRALLTADELDRQIASAVATSLSVLRLAVAGTRSAEAAVAAYRDAVANERKKQRAGLSTIFDVILTEGRLTTAEGGLLRARARAASALSRLRFETGTLIDVSGAGPAIDVRALSTTP
jgi:outer membrane protein TolC